MQPRVIEFVALEVGKAQRLLQECFCMCRVVVMVSVHLSTNLYVEFEAVFLTDHKTMIIATTV